MHMNDYIPALTVEDDWPLAKEFRTQLCLHDYRPPAADGVVNPLKAEKMAACLAGRNALENLSLTKCGVCAGFGHTSKWCPTAPRLTTLFSFHSITKAKLAAARSRMTIEKAHHLEPNAPVPKCKLPYKRTFSSRVPSSLASSGSGGGLSQ